MKKLLIKWIPVIVVTILTVGMISGLYISKKIPQEVVIKHSIDDMRSINRSMFNVQTITDGDDGYDNMYIRGEKKHLIALLLTEKYNCHVNKVGTGDKYVMLLVRHRRLKGCLEYLYNLDETTLID